ncbi:efflux RND transporter periplasmic adaptor subunit [Geomonas sp. Red32]|uniref:efflux RND transporter periplasmic adaptor subunit n=1 Tax=Geomonas sp. Red32 TaxID=2912856 RepID=UPI00202CD472|nr:efflux RND transporter periplasmic adaptor subunit [Geomonas sp. Red32]MCM0081320.1 efflux RND transporter periplasmic adaptor subunit [Geomonas sp. Red32]
MKMRKLTMMAVGASLLFAAATGCSKKSEAKVPAGPPQVAVEILPVQGSDLVDGIEVTGTLAPKNEAEVKTEIPGLVKELYVTEWVRVRKGQPLARISLAETEALVKRAEANVQNAKAALLQVKVAAERSEREKQRVIKLKEAGLATQQSVDDAISDAEAAQARIEAARAQIRAGDEELSQQRARLAKGLVRSPIDGVVALKDVNIGSLTSDGAAAKPIFKIVDNRLMNLTVTVPSSQMAGVKLGQPLQFVTDGVPGRTFTGKVMFINPAVDEADRSLKVIAEVPNVPEVLKGGLFVKGKILTGTRKNVLQVPRATLAGLDLDKHSGYLYVVENGIAHKREVVTGAVAGELVEIVSGVKAGEQVISRGGFNVKDGDRVVVANAAAPAAR